MTDEYFHIDSKLASSLITDSAVRRTTEQNTLLMSLLADSPSAYLVDENGIPIKPGYRKPFQKGYDPRRYKGQRKLTITDASKLIEKLQSMLDDASISKRKSLSKPRSATNHGVVTRDSKPTPNSPTISPRPVKKNASQVKPEGVNSAVSPATPQNGS